MTEIPLTGLLWVGLGGFVGAILRYTLSAWAHRIYEGPFPIGTLLVNVVGCLAIGLLLALFDRGLGTEPLRLFATAGLLGALTTFSTFGYETLDLLRSGSYGLALANILANVTLGLLAAWAGSALVRG